MKLAIFYLFFIVAQVFCFQDIGRNRGYESQQALAARAFERRDCTKPVEEGSEHCRALLPVYWWNDEKQKCEKTWYGGCNSTKNRFETEDKCKNIAEKICKKH